MNRKRGITVFLTTQYLEEADRLANRIAIIDHGRIVAEGSPEELKASIGADIVAVGVPEEQVARAEKALATLDGLKEIQSDAKGLTLFVHDGSGAVARVIRLLDKAKINVGSITVSLPTLDEVFLRLTGSRLEGSTEEVAS